MKRRALDDRYVDAVQAIYARKKLTMAEIAELFSVDTKTISNWLRVKL